MILKVIYCFRNVTVKRNKNTNLDFKLRIQRQVVFPERWLVHSSGWLPHDNQIFRQCLNASSLTIASADPGGQVVVASWTHFWCSPWALGLRRYPLLSHSVSHSSTLCHAFGITHILLHAATGDDSLGWWDCFPWTICHMPQRPALRSRTNYDSQRRRIWSTATSHFLFGAHNLF